MSDPISALDARYRASFPEKRAELLAALVAWRTQPTSPDTIAAVYLRVHKLAGSAGAYGFDALTDIARIADRLLQPHAHGGEALTEAQIAPIHAAVVAVAEALQD